MSETPWILFEKLHADVPSPEYHSENASCFDLAAYIAKGHDVTCYVNDGSAGKAIGHDLVYLSKDPLKDVGELADNRIWIWPGHRVLIPTGLKAIIQPGWEAEVRLRSSAAKHSLRLCNGVGTIDADYRGEWFIPIENISDDVVEIEHGVRLVQVKIQEAKQATIRFLDHEAFINHPNYDTKRGSGAFGSTGQSA